MEAVNQDLEKLQIVELVLNGNTYGVNILKVQEILVQQPYIEVPNSNEDVKGIFNYRGNVIPIINLHKALNMEDSEIIKNTLVLNFNNVLYAFEVDDVIGTSTYEWDVVEDVNEGLKNHSQNSYTGIINDGEKIIMIIDFETIIGRLDGLTEEASYNELENFDFSKIEKFTDINIAFAEDSGMMSLVIKAELLKAGFENINSFVDGKSALEYIENTDDQIDLFILDIEMPYVNGFTLTTKIRESEKFKDTPVILFSSLINDENKSRGEKVGADYQVSKPDLNRLISIVGKVLDDKNK